MENNFKALKLPTVTDMKSVAMDGEVSAVQNHADWLRWQVGGMGSNPSIVTVIDAWETSEIVRLLNRMRSAS